MKRLLPLVLFLAFGGMWMVVSATAQDDAKPPVAKSAPPTTAAKTTVTKTDKAKEEDSPADRTASYRRLPAYFPIVISSAKQRDEVYKIQETYGERIRKLEEQLKALKAERDEKVLGVLTAEQRKHYDELKEKAKKSKN